MLATGGVILTTAGSLLISRSLELVKPIEFTHMKIGTGDISSIAQARKLNDLVISYKNINMSTLVRSGDLVRVRGSFTNDEIVETVRIKEVGVFAKIGTEQPILFGYVNDGEGELIPPGTSGIVARTRDLYIGITGEAEVAITINKSLVYATIEDLEEGLNRKEDKFLKRSGFNLEKTDLTENDSNKVFTPKGALRLFDTLTTNFTNGINAAKEILRLDIVKKLNKGVYSGDAQDLKNDIDTKEPIINKKSGWNLEKTDLTENDTNKVFTPKGAFDLKNWLVENYTTLMNNIRENLTNMINTKTPHGGYSKSSQDLKNDIDTKVSKNGDTINGTISSNSHTMIYSTVTKMHLHSNSDFIGFLNNADNWIFRVGQDGQVIARNIECSNINSSGNISITNGAPVIELHETDTGVKTYLVADGEGGRLQRDSTVGANIFSWDKNTAYFYGLASGNVNKLGDTMTGQLQMDAPIQAAGWMTDNGAIGALGGGSFRFGVLGLNWRIGVIGSNGHLGFWTQQEDKVIFQPYNFSPDGKFTTQNGLKLPKVDGSSIDVMGRYGGYDDVVGFNCGLNVANANGALEALVVPSSTSTFTPMIKIQTVMSDGVGYTSRYVTGTLTTGSKYGRYQLLAYGDDPSNLLATWTWDMNDGTFETNRLKVNGTSIFSTEIVSNSHTMMRSTVTGMHLHSNGNAIGFLNSSGGWIFRVDQVTGEVISSYSSIVMPTGQRMYSEGDSIGFLGTDTNWRFRTDNDGNAFAEGKINAKGGKIANHMDSLAGEYAGLKSTSHGILANRYASGISWNDTPTDSGFDIKAELGLLRPSTNPGEWGSITLSSIVNRDASTTKLWEFGMRDGSFNCPGIVTSQGSEVLTFANTNRYCPHRVGDIIESLSAEHPASTWLGTGWERYGNGMVVVGVSEGEGEFASAGQTGGSKYVSLTAAQNGPHNHPVTTVVGGNGWYGQGGNLGPFGTIGTGASGNGEAHNNMQPYVALYRWIRVS